MKFVHYFIFLDTGPYPSGCGYDCHIMISPDSCSSSMQAVPFISPAVLVLELRISEHPVSIAVWREVDVCAEHMESVCIVLMKTAL